MEENRSLGTGPHPITAAGLIDWPWTSLRHAARHILFSKFLDLGQAVTGSKCVRSIKALLQADCDPNSQSGRQREKKGKSQELTELSLRTMHVRGIFHRRKTRPIILKTRCDPESRGSRQYAMITTNNARGFALEAASDRRDTAHDDHLQMCLRWCGLCLILA